MSQGGRFNISHSASYEDFSSVPEPMLSVCKQYKVTECLEDTSPFDFLNTDEDEDGYYEDDYEDEYYDEEDGEEEEEEEDEEEEEEEEEGKDKETAKCKWDDGNIPGYLPADGYDWQRKHHATLDFSLSYLKAWNNTLSDWSLLWERDSQVANPQKPTVIPLSKEEILLCFALNFSQIIQYPILAFAPYQALGSTESVLYVHAANQLFEPSRTNIPLPLAQGLKKTYELELTYNRQLPTEDVPCSESQKSYDGCILGHAVERMMLEANCSIVFLGNNETACRDFASGQKAMEAYWSAFWNTTATSMLCPKPCNFFNVDINFQTHDLLLEMFADNSYLYEGGDFRDLRLEPPSSVEVITTRYSYGVISFVAELGGWMGLFLGKLVHKLHLYSCSGAIIVLLYYCYHF